MRLCWFAFLDDGRGQIVLRAKSKRELKRGNILGQLLR